MAGSHVHISASRMHRWKRSREYLDRPQTRVYPREHLHTRGRKGVAGKGEAKYRIVKRLDDGGGEKGWVSRLADVAILWECLNHDHVVNPPIPHLVSALSVFLYPLRSYALSGRRVVYKCIGIYISALYVCWYLCVVPLTSPRRYLPYFIFRYLRTVCRRSTSLGCLHHRETLQARVRVRLIKVYDSRKLH